MHLLGGFERLNVNRKIRFGLLAATVLAVAFLAWFVIVALSAYTAIKSLEQNARSAYDAAREGDTATAQSLTTAITEDSERARRATSALPWRLAAAVPWLGSPLDTASASAVVVDELADGVLTPLAHDNVLRILNPESEANQMIDITAAVGAYPQIKQAAEASAIVSTNAREIPEAAYFSRVNEVRTDLIERTAQLASALDTASAGIQVLPKLLGAEEPREYLVVFQTNAEARGTGGLMGGAGILHADNGVVTFDSSVSNDELPTVAVPLELGPEYEALYGQWDSTSNWQNANFSPHFPYAAQIWYWIWAQHMDQIVDGVFATDPVALSYLLEAAGPVTLSSGEVIDHTNVVSLTLNDAYFRFGEDHESRKQFLQEISGAVMAKVNTFAGSKQSLLMALGKAANEGRIAFWSAHAEEQEIVQSTPIGNALPQDTAPYAHVVLNNGAGGKLDYYLERTISYTAGSCDGVQRDSEVVATLENTAPALPHYPRYLMGRLTPETRYSGPPGTNRTVVSLFATHGAELQEITVNGRRVPVTLSHQLLGHPVFSVVVVTKPGETSTIRFGMTEPTAAGAARVPVQPLATDAAVTVAVPEC